MRPAYLPPAPAKKMAARITHFGKWFVSGALHLLLMMKPLVPSAAATAIAACYVVGAAASLAAETPRQPYDIARGDAALTLKRFADASGRQVVYLVDTVRGVVTNPVRGTFTAREVLDQLLRHTALVVVEDAKSGALMIQRAESPESATRPPSSSKSESDPSAKPSMKSSTPGRWLAALFAVVTTADLPAQNAPQPAGFAKC